VPGSAKRLSYGAKRLPYSAKRLPYSAKRLPCSVALVLFAGYATISVSRHLRLQTTGYDLGIFEQAIRAYAHFRAPVSDLKGPGYNLLGDHFHPILVTIAPFYRLFPSPITLLVAQALLLAVSAIPVTRMAVRQAGPVKGTAIGLAYGLSWGLQQAVGFDFHEIAFAVPLIAFSLERLARDEWRPAVRYALPLVLVKEDLAITVVAALGAYLVLHRQWRLGLAVMAYGVLSALLIVFVLIPALNPDGAYAYFCTVQGGSGQNPLIRFFTPEVKYGTVLMLLAPTAFLALRSPLLLLAVPTLTWRFWSIKEVYWGIGDHYSAVLMPIVFIAFVDALGRLSLSRRGLDLALAVCVGFALIATAWLPFRQLAGPYGVSNVRGILNQIPDGATVAASNRLVPQLTSRTTVSLFPQNFPLGVRPQWVAVLDDEFYPVSPADSNAARVALPSRGYRLVRHQDRVWIYRLSPTRTR
jgi:uncharacterized membrane protein